MAEPAERARRDAPTPLPTAPAESIAPPNALRAHGEPRTLRDHIGVLRQRWWIVAVCTGVAIVVALGFSLMQPTRYQATTEVLVPLQVPTGGDAAQQLQAQRSFDPNRAMQDEARLSTAATVVEDVRKQVGGGVALTAKAVKDADVLQLTATADTAEQARNGADAAARVYLAKHNDAVAKGTAPAVVLQPAALPSSPSQPATVRNLALAALLGLLVGIALAYLLDALSHE